MNKAGEQATKATKERMTEPVKEYKNSPELNELMEKLLKGEEIFETVETDRGTFKIKYPRPRLLRTIQILLADRFMGQNLNNIPENTVRNHEVYATLDMVVVEAPEWWDKLETSEDCPDDALISELYRRYLRFYRKIQQKIGNSGTESGENNSGQPSGAKKEAVDNGAFQGLAN